MYCLFFLNGKVLVVLFLIQKEYFTCKDVLNYPKMAYFEAPALIY